MLMHKKTLQKQTAADSNMMYVPLYVRHTLTTCHTTSIYSVQTC